jgi:hypothetical protein
VADLTVLKAKNLARWQAAHVLVPLLPLVDGVAQKLVSAKPRYQAVGSSARAEIDPPRILSAC